MLHNVHTMVSVGGINCHCEPEMCVGERESYNVAVRVELERVLEANGVIVHRQNGSEHLPLLGNNVICQNTIV